MSATGVDSAVFRDIFSTEEMRAIFSDEQRVQYYLDIEAALARVQAGLGIIPKEAAEEIGRHCHADQIDLAKLKTQSELIGYPVLGLLAENKEIAAHMSRDELAKLVDPANYLGQCGDMVDNVLSKQGR